MCHPMLALDDIAGRRVRTESLREKGRETVTKTRSLYVRANSCRGQEEGMRNVCSHGETPDDPWCVRLRHSTWHPATARPCVGKVHSWCVAFADRDHCRANYPLLQPEALPPRLA